MEMAVFETEPQHSKGISWSTSLLVHAVSVHPSAFTHIMYHRHILNVIHVICTEMYILRLVVLLAYVINYFSSLAQS